MQKTLKNKKWRRAAVVVIVLLVTWGLLGRNADTDQRPAGAEVVATEEPTAEEPSTVIPRQVVTGPAMVLPAVTPVALKDEQPEVLEYFKALTRYPASTRRINENSADLLKPNARHEKRGKLPNLNDNDDLNWDVLYTADRYFVRGAEPVLISLELWHDDVAVRPQNVMMVAEAKGRDGKVRAMDLQVATTDDGSSSIFIPNQPWPDLVGPIKVAARFSAEDLAEQIGYLDLYFTGSTQIPAEFTGEVHDNLQNGDLLVDVAVDVYTPGRYFIEANLYDNQSRPFGWARFDGEMGTGVQRASMRFFGLLFRDAEASGPYTVGELRGRRLRPGDMPDREDMPDFPGRYTTTRAYALSDFRAQEADSPRRQRMLDLYQDAIDRGVKFTQPEYVDSLLNP
jgi:hypothetical protein